MLKILTILISSAWSQDIQSDRSFTLKDGTDEFYFKHGDSLQLQENDLANLKRVVTNYTLQRHLFGRSIANMIWAASLAAPSAPYAFYVQAKTSIRRDVPNFFEVSWMIYHHPSNKFAGTLSVQEPKYLPLNVRAQDTALIVASMDDDFRGKGYVRRFGPQALAHLQTLPELKNKKQFLIEALPENTAANKTAQRLGFTNIGVTPILVDYIITSMTTTIQGWVKVFRK